MFLNLNCLMGCEGVSAGRARAQGDVGQIVQPACLSHLLAAPAEMLSKTGACGRAGRAFPGGRVSAQLRLLGDCQGPTCPSQALDMRLQRLGARPAPVPVHPAEGGGCPWTRWLCSSGSAGAGDVQGRAGLCMGLPGTGGVLCSEAAAGSSCKASMSPGTALPCLSMVQHAARLVLCPGTAQRAPWHRSTGREQKNNNRASGDFGTTLFKTDPGNELDASHTLPNTQI